MTEAGPGNLIEAVESGDLDATRDLVQGGADLAQRDDKGATPLHYAMCGRYEIAKYLLSKGADTEAVDGFGLTPLQVAFLRHDRALYTLLVRHGADADRPLPDGRSPAAVLREQKGWFA